MTPARPDPETVVVTLRDEPRDEYPPRPFAVRLRHALKTLLRRDGLRCVRLADGHRVDVVTRPVEPSPDSEI